MKISKFLYTSKFMSSMRDFFSLRISHSISIFSLDDLIKGLLKMIGAFS